MGIAKYPMIIVNETLPLVVLLNPNPNNISMDRAKVFSKTQTLGGWVFEHWGEQPRVLKVRGRTQTVLGTGNNLLTLPGPNTMVGVELALYSLQQIYNLDKRPGSGLFAMLKNAATQAGLLKGSTAPSQLPLASTFIYYKLDLYQGFFTHFRYKQDAETMPRHYEYEFEFLVTGSAQNTLSESGPGQAVGQFVGAGGLNLLK